jgi:hypothetical protein
MIDGGAANHAATAGGDDALARIQSRLQAKLPFALRRAIPSAWTFPHWFAS